MTSESPKQAIHVVAGVVIDAKERVLIAQRPPGKHMADGWEFPGGKLEPGEERLAGLARELQEELGIAIATETARPLIRVRHSYPSCDVLLDIWVIRNYKGEPRGLDGQALQWCTLDELATVQLLPADGPIVAALRLPARLTLRATPFYHLGAAGVEGPPPGNGKVSTDGRLRGVFCSNRGQAIAAAAGGAGFLLIRDELTDDRLADICRSVPLPVFARKTPLESAFALGLSGINDIAP